MAWDRAILTDSGGYQVFSLAPLRRVSNNGVIFRSHIDGSEHLITPELAIQFQEALGADIIMVLDECPAHDDSLEKVQRATDRTHQWAERCQKAQRRGDQALYAIVQGGTFSQLRHQSVEYLTSLGFAARSGAIFTRQGRHNIKNAAFSQIGEPVDPDCDCYTCRTFSAAYLHHLFNCNELLAYRLATIHNLNFICNLVSRARSAVLNDTFSSFKDDFLASYKTTDEQIRLKQRQEKLKSRKPHE